ncbi:DUF294 nucleotidyltransferase-like domain-containing protein [Alteribacillus sp. JSM 102045]|uniref:DUF294 nucleotidyltransferase-like domain-containing protein n=1 Tax=Alteribacillus sp. JSM 102045 TaxID=1562101 RepID=UPI0035BEFACC
MTSSASYKEEEFLLPPSFDRYEDIKSAREKESVKVAGDPVRLNEAHDHWVLETLSLAVHRVKSERGPVPAHFAFFVMGSSGRKEQALWSDQDHGIVFDGKDASFQDYFLFLGEELREGMAVVGYPRCEGKVMASHPRWCHGLNEWKKQVDVWIENDRWESYRHLLTFIDARMLAGKKQLLADIKEHIFFKVSESSRILERLAENTSYLHQGTNAFGKLLPEEKGPYAGSLHIKDVGFFPYVHAMRLLAIKEGIHTSSTLERMNKTAEKYPFVRGKIEYFHALLDLRASFWKSHQTYEDVHYVPVHQLTKEQKKTLKTAVKEGKHLFQQTKKSVESGEGIW